MTAFEASPRPRHPDVLAAESRYERFIRVNFEIVKANVHPKTGLWPAVEPLNTPESKENHMDHAWIRDSAMNLIGMIEASANLKLLDQDNKLAAEIDEFIGKNITKMLKFFDQDRWNKRFDQRIYVGEWSECPDPPEIHMLQNGDPCPWDQNQPECWGDFLIAVGRAHETGIIKDYKKKEKEFIKRIARYLVNIDPTIFAGAGMWEGRPGHSPSSRSNAILVGKGLKAVDFLFEEGTRPRKKVDFIVRDAIDFARESEDFDFTTPDGHPNGIDLAMLVAMAMPGSEETRLRFAEYVRRNGATLKIGDLPGAIRFVSDTYQTGELGEALWFMAIPILAIGYFQEAAIALKNWDVKTAKEYLGEARKRLEQALEIMDIHDGHAPELFKPRRAVSQEDFDNPLTKNGVVPDALNRSLLWNRALMMIALSQAAVVENLFSQTV
jgi:hypothetical protein